MKWLGMPLGASAHAPEIDRVLSLEHWMMLALFLFWSGYFLFVIIRFRSSANPKANYVGMKSYWSVYLVLLVAFAEAALLIGYEIPQWQERTRNIPSAGEATVIRVVGEQFNWNFHYPGADRRFGRTDIALASSDNPLGIDRTDTYAQDDIVTLNMMTVPVGHPVLLHLTSKDVIHSFGSYEMRVKQDATPGLDTPVWFVPTTTTAEMRRRLGKPDFVYEIACSQLCGLGHFRMRAFLTVATDAEYRTFLAEQAPAPVR